MSSTMGYTMYMGTSSFLVCSPMYNFQLKVIMTIISIIIIVAIIVVVIITMGMLVVGGAGHVGLPPLRASTNYATRARATRTHLGQLHPHPRLRPHPHFCPLLLISNSI